MASGLEQVGGDCVPENRHATGPWNSFLEQLDLLGRQLSLPQKHSGDVTARSRQAVDKSERERIIVDSDDHDGPRASDLLGGTQREVAAGSDDEI